MTTLPTVHKPGLKVWRAVLLELLRREREGEKPASILALATRTQRSDTQTATHLESMARADLITLESRMGYHGSIVQLTGMGRLVARLLEIGPEIEKTNPSP